MITGEVLVRQLQGGQPFGSGVSLGTNQQAQFTGLTPPVTRLLTPSEAVQLSNSFKATKTDAPAAMNAPLIIQSQELATQVLTSGTAKSGSSSQETSSNKGSSDTRLDETAQEATRARSGRESLTDAANSAKVMNSLSPTERQELNHVIQQLKSSGSSSNSGSGSSNSGGGGSVTLSTGTQVILQNGKAIGSHSGHGVSGHTGH